MDTSEGNGMCDAYGKRKGSLEGEDGWELRVEHDTVW